MIAQQLQYYVPDIFKPFPEMTAAESTRFGGVSTLPFQSLNLGLYTEDDPNAVQENRKIFFSRLGFRPEQAAGAKQEHGDHILQVGLPGQYEGYDALVTRSPGILLTVTVADCAPVLIYDPVQKAVGAVHAGWRGTVAGITAKTIGRMVSLFNTNPADCRAFIGSCIGECCFEVGDEVAEHFDKAFKRWNTATGKYHVDIKSANREQLLREGLLAENIEVSPHCTFQNKDYFSHRRDRGQTGRMLGVIGLAV